MQAWTYLGLIADDVALAVSRYPELDSSHDRALKALEELVSSDLAPDQRSAIPRRRSMNDPSIILHRAASLAQHAEESPAEADAHDLSFVRGPLERLRSHDATGADLNTVGEFAEVLARVTLAFAERLSNEKGVDDWMPRALTFSPA